MSPEVIRNLFKIRMVRLVKRAHRLDEEALKRVMRLLNDVRKDVISTIASTDWQIYRLNEMKLAVDRAMLDFGQKYKDEFAKIQRQFNDLGILYEDVPLRTIGIKLDELLVSSNVITAIDPTVLAIIQDYTPDLITGMTQDGIARIQRAISSGLLGQKTAFDVVKEVGTNLTDKSVFNSIADRAFTITRTEGSRVLQAASHARGMQALQILPGIGKEWKHDVWGKKPRTGHQHADGQQRQEDEYFDIAPDYPINYKRPMEQLMYPKDPRGSAYNTINCDCYMIPWHPNWDQARKIAAESGALRKVA